MFLRERRENGEGEKEERGERVHLEWGRDTVGWGGDTVRYGRIRHIDLLNNTDTVALEM